MSNTRIVHDDASYRVTIDLDSHIVRIYERVSSRGRALEEIPEGPQTREYHAIITRLARTVVGLDDYITKLERAK